MQRIIIEVNSDIKDFYRDYAKDKGSTMSYVIRNLLDEFKKKQTSRSTASKRRRRS